MAGTEIRTANAADLRAIRRVLKAAYRGYLAALPGLPDVTAITKAELAIHAAWVAEKEGEVVGLCLLYLDPPRAHLSNIAVHPDHTGQGIARRLVEKTVTVARTAGCNRIDLATHPDMGANVALYERMGWSVTERTMHKVRMSRRI